MQHVPVIRIIKPEKSLKAEMTCFSETLQESTKLKAALDKTEKDLQEQRQEWEKEKNCLKGDHQLASMKLPAHNTGCGVFLVKFCGPRSFSFTLFPASLH